MSELKLLYKGTSSGRSLDQAERIAALAREHTAVKIEVVIYPELKALRAENAALREVAEAAKSACFNDSHRQSHEDLYLAIAAWRKKFGGKETVDKDPDTL